MPVSSPFNLAQLHAAPLMPSTRGPRDATNAAPPPLTKKETAMPRVGTKIKVLEALNKKSPQTRAQLLGATGLDERALGNAIYNLQCDKKVVRGPNGSAGLPGADFKTLDFNAGTVPHVNTASAPPPKPKPKTTTQPKPGPFAAALKGAEARTDAADAALALRATVATTEPHIDVRAIRAWGGGALILEDNHLIAELTPAQFAAVGRLLDGHTHDEFPK